VVGLPDTGGAAPQLGPFAALLARVAPTSAKLFASKPLAALASMDLRAGPVGTSLELWIPALRIGAPVLAVGITSKNVMAAPGGLVTDPVWQQVFWYRGSGIPGDLGTATIAGHVVDRIGRPAIFARLQQLRPGSLIVVYDTQSGLEIRFRVVRAEGYSMQQAADLSVLAQIYGSGPISGQRPQPAVDGLSHLTLITCSGDFLNGAYSRRWVVYAEREQALPTGRAGKNRSATPE